MKNILITSCFFLLAAMFSCGDKVAEIGKEDSRPNIVLILADDLGYADLGCFGGDIETPNIDALAARGTTFSRFHASPFCAPSRAMLLSGNDNHIAGMGLQGIESDSFGYEGKLTSRILPIPELLKQVGYHTYMAGKWHLGHSPDANPHQKGFEKSFVLLPGAGNHYDDQSIFSFSPTSDYTENGQKAGWKKGDYSTDFYTDKLISYINQNKDDRQPFFAYAAYTSPHWPLQVDEQFEKKYRGRYEDGYEKLKERRLKSLKKAGMIPPDAELPPNHPNIKPWDDLTKEEQRKEARKMELYAGMVDNLDANVGRLIDYLKSIDQYENTLIVFMSDNGAAAEDFYHDDRFSGFVRQHFNEDYDNMGQPNSFISYGPQWAEAGSSPFRYYKGYTSEGGMIAPMIIAGPGVKRTKEIHPVFSTLMDIAPTFYEVAQTTYPENMEGRKLYPLLGNSLIPFLSGKKDTIHSADYVFGLEHKGYAMIRKGDWKINNIERPFDIENFKLYNLKNDMAELHDQKDSAPEKYAELLAEWEQFAAKKRVQIPYPRRGE